MSETSNISTMAVHVHKTCLVEFGWNLSGPRDQNWECVLESHVKKTHPSDVVFRYSDPYSEGDLSTYVSTDLKSYATGSLSRQGLRTAIQSLLMSTECANLSPQFQRHYIEPGCNADVIGLLFIYNHDSGYDKDFRSLLVRAMEDISHELQRNRRVFIMGPDDVLYLHDLANDMKLQRGDHNYPSDREDLEFFYPDLVRRKARKRENRAASLEMLLGPYQIVRYQISSDKRTETKYTLYYRGSGADYREYVYLIDGLSRYQILQHADEVTICVGRPDKDSASQFQRAVDAYVNQFHGFSEMRERLGIVKYRALQNHALRFSEVQIGMESR